MADICECFDATTKSKVALKFLRDYDDAECVKRFKQEAELAMQLHHENLCAVIEYGTSDGQPFIAMPLLQGTSLSQEIEHGPLEIERATGIACQILSALQIIHDADVIHRDLKPSNIFLDQSMQQEVAKVLDLGISKRFDSKTTNLNVAFGTAHYMSPERIHSISSTKGDIYAVGVILYEMLTGQKPYDGRPEDVRDDIIAAKPFISPGRKNPKVPSEIERIVITAMSRDPEDRYSSALKMKDALQVAVARWTAESIPRPVTIDATRDDHYLGDQRSDLMSESISERRSTKSSPSEINIDELNLKTDYEEKSLIQRIKDNLLGGPRSEPMSERQPEKKLEKTSEPRSAKSSPGEINIDELNLEIDYKEKSLIQRIKNSFKR
ncbi:MAG: serine/threonine protein kinase [Proteobacteria bacterium]|nr:serine/threonine protein kinase [Pseudomonadota bacterium]